MDTAQVLDLAASVDRDDARTAAWVDIAAATAPAGGLVESLLDRRELALDAAALTRVVLVDDPAVPPHPEAALVLSHAIVALALGHNAGWLQSDDELVDVGRQDAGHAEELAAAGPAFAAFATAARGALAALSGWPNGCAAYGGALAATVDVLAHERQLAGVAPSVAGLDAADRVGADLVALAAAIVRDDRTIMHLPSECELALQLANQTVARAREVLALLGQSGPLRPTEAIARRFSIPPDVMRLGPTELERAMRALFAADLLDLGDLLRHIGRDTPFGDALARTVGAMVALADRDHELVIATVRPESAAIMTELRVAARLDGRITADERALLRGMDEHLVAFDHLVARIQEDHIVDFDEFRQLRTARQAILDDILRIALADDVVTDDERALLVRALELIPMLRTPTGAPPTA
jgi:hypothetical protein